MNKLSLNTIIKEKDQIQFDYHVSDGIKNISATHHLS